MAAPSCRAAELGRWVAMRATAGFFLLLAACQGTPDRFDYRSSCGWGDNRPWELVDSLPTDREGYYRLADEHPNLKTDPRGYSVESWFFLPTGELMLCRSDGPPKDSCVGEWWQFEGTGDGLRMSAQSAWVCVT